MGSTVQQITIDFFFAAFGRLPPGIKKNLTSGSLEFQKYCTTCISCICITFFFEIHKRQ